MQHELLYLLTQFVMAIATVGYAYITWRQWKSSPSINNPGSANPGHMQSISGVSRLNKIIFKWLTFFFAAFGAISIFVFAFLSLIAIGINAIMPNWNPMEKFQEGLASGVITVIAPRLATIQRTDLKSQDLQVGGNTIKTERFTVLLSPATRDDYIHLKATIKNTTSKPLYIALNNEARASLIDDRSGATSNIIEHPGILGSSMSRGGVEKEEATYTQIPPEQTLVFGLKFYNYHPIPRGVGLIHITLSFLCLLDDQVKSLSVSPDTSIR